MNSPTLVHLSLWPLRAAALIILCRAESFGLNADRILLLTFKYSILKDPFQVLESWKNYDQTPCSWNGVTCGTVCLADATFRVTGLSLPDSGLSGSIPATLGLIEHLTNLNLSNNLINGSLPATIFHAAELQTLDISNNLISGELPELVGRLKSLRLLNLSYNGLYGRLPQSLSVLHNLTAVSLKNNYFTGPIPSGFDSVRFLDLSSNLINGSLPADFGGGNLSYLNVSFNRLSGEIPLDFSRRIPGNATLDLSFNNLTGPLKALSPALAPVTSSSAAATLPSSAVRQSPPAIPKTFGSTGGAAGNRRVFRRVGLRLGTVIGIVAGVGILASSSDHEGHAHGPEQKSRTLVTVDAEKELELETLLKASAYILGASGSSIMYKAVLEDGTTLAVRRVGQNGLERFGDFHNQVRVIAKLVHPNLVRIRGFYWGTDEKLIIYDFVSNGSLANARYRKAGSSPCHVSWETRLKIARGVARGLSYIHEKKHVHGNLKPNNILLGPDMEPKISDFGLQRLVSCDYNTSRPDACSTHKFDSKRSTPGPSVVGPSPYRAPESLGSQKPSPKWDVFSFGVILLELLTGKVPGSLDETAGALSASSDEERRRVVRMANVAIRWNVEGNEEAFMGLLRLGYACVSPVPQKRPAMREVLHALERFPSCLFSTPSGL
ncbi:Leucine-rich repeat protein kinase family protein [Striga hermonthica]|uniref:Leucine-rich repeat protein kinase family protein n=1 Tax=Striga hermonthica TaxID=68872 RepID=A0A9N7RJZ7_STRHE|nr:Leucine-rich repeat protein kinase family protein [Striga hermonthica]